jgi:hypothetical protein
VALECETFPQAERALRSGRYAAFLPTLAGGDLPARAFYVLRSPAFGRHAMRLFLAWHGRLARTRPRVADLAPALASALQIAPTEAVG